MRIVCISVDFGYYGRTGNACLVPRRPESRAHDPGGGFHRMKVRKSKFVNGIWALEMIAPRPNEWQRVAARHSDLYKLPRGLLKAYFETLCVERQGYWQDFYLSRLGKLSLHELQYFGRYRSLKHIRSSSGYFRSVRIFQGCREYIFCFRRFLQILILYCHRI